MSGPSAGHRPDIDYTAVFRAVPSPTVLLAPDFTVVDVNEAYLRVAGRRREHLLGRVIFEVFPDNPADQGATGVANLRTSLRRVLETGEPDSMVLQRYDVEAPGRPGVFEERWWIPVNAPVLGPDGTVQLIMHEVEEVTSLIHEATGPAGAARLRAMEADLLARSDELHDLNERLRQALMRDREVALALQEAMLQAPGQTSHGEVAVRYRPASSGLNVCGDWYDLAELPEGRLAVAVGDVVGHGLAAAGVMGQLRSALSAAVRTGAGPASALQVLSRYAESVKGAESTTVVQAVIDWQAHSITYTCAGHPPPALLRTAGTVDFLDQATDPPLGARPEGGPEPEATTPFREGDTLVLYTDGLIERRGEGIDVGLSRLASSLILARHLRPESLADTLLAALGVAAEPTDDTALVVIRL